MNLEPQQTFQIIAMLAVLALFCFSLRDKINYARWFKQWEADRKARRDAELAEENGDDPSITDDAPRGPWG